MSGVEKREQGRKRDGQRAQKGGGEEKKKRTVREVGKVEENNRGMR